jgi:hypothetical protein
MPGAYGDLLGVYVHREAGLLLRLEWRDGKLAVVEPTDPEWRPTLGPTEDRDVFVVEPGVRESGEPAVFRRTLDGRVASLFLAAETWARLDPVV